MKNFTSHVDDFGHRTQEELENQTDLLDVLGCSLGNTWEEDRNRSWGTNQESHRFRGQEWVFRHPSIELLLKAPETRSVLSP